MASIPKLKSDKKYTDAPRYPMIYDYEGEFKSNYNKLVKAMSVSIAATLVKSIEK